MKTLIPKCLLVLGLIVLFQGCSTAPKKSKTSTVYEKLGNFDRVYIPNEVALISQMINVVQPELEAPARNKIAANISHAIKKHKVEPQIVIALIDTESNFQYNKVSSTGDLSLAQINVEVWNAEFSRMKLPLIQRERLVIEDQAYAMEVMAKILSILKTRHAKKDRRWYARYHSNTSKYKMDYLKKIEIRMKMLSQVHATTSQKALALSSQNSPRQQ
jgi:PBP1b-binding outer membrane lipoprotein LpoB